jgi:hypothetical protein
LESKKLSKRVYVLSKSETFIFCGNFCKFRSSAANHGFGLMIKMAFQTPETNYLERVAL